MNCLTDYAVRSTSHDTRNAERLTQWAERWRARHGSYPTSYTQQNDSAEPNAVLSGVGGEANPTKEQQQTAEILIHPAVFRRLRKKSARQAEQHQAQTQVQS